MVTTAGSHLCLMVATAGSHLCLMVTTAGSHLCLMVTTAGSHLCLMVTTAGSHLCLVVTTAGPSCTINPVPNDQPPVYSGPIEIMVPWVIGSSVLGESKGVAFTILSLGEK